VTRVNRLVWVDCEMTGLDIERDALIEVAVLVTDSELNVLGDGVNIVIKPPAAALEAMGEVVQRMHTDSGLLDRLDGGVTLAEAQEQCIAYVRQHLPESPRPPLAGNSVGTDRLFLDRDLPEFAALLHYRIVDVSSIKELARRWYPKAYYASPTKHGGHRALGDIEDSIDELRYYRATVFAPQPGPDTATCRAVAASLDRARSAVPVEDVPAVGSDPTAG
jgi:oligoribonuclease (3'-5' exoribonuclease)